ncbi:anti-sigma factor [Pedobacter ginsengisoli]|uniref:Anti-sigma factor n=2 Tax=Pedobacter ginsengisoli TaxID=363852 RepID=A0A2D1U6I8_9SPHI|nr:anti-sigma factor [Pedobacter ginsengisoli]
MSMEKKDIKKVLDKVSAGTATPQEEQAAKYWLHYFSKDDIPELSEDELNQETEAIYKSLMKEKVPVKVNRLWYPAVAAACLLMVVGAGLFYYRQHNPEVKQVTAANIVPNDVAPAKNTATLTLADGKKITLADAPIGLIAEQRNVSIFKTADGKLIYKSKPLKASETTFLDNPELNIISTAKGQQYQVILPDGSKIWLNAASSFTFPATFVSLKQRKVELTGEAYFEVAKDKSHPFIVKTDKQEVEVLGTHFNVNSYSDEEAIKTTLLEGSVKVSNSNEQKILRPGQESLLAKSSLVIRNADTQEAVAWKNGDFIFNNEDFGSILRQVARWYNVEIIDNGNHENLHLSGTVSRSKNISAVLKALEITGKVKFMIDGNRVIVAK